MLRPEPSPRATTSSAVSAYDHCVPKLSGTTVLAAPPVPSTRVKAAPASAVPLRVTPCSRSSALMMLSSVTASTDRLPAVGAAVSSCTTEVAE